MTPAAHFLPGGQCGLWWVHCPHVALRPRWGQALPGMSCTQGPSGLAEAPSLPRTLGGSPGTETPAKLHALCLFACSLSGTLGAKSRFRDRAVVGEGSRMCVVGLWEEEPSEGGVWEQGGGAA